MGTTSELLGSQGELEPQRLQLRRMPANPDVDDMRRFVDMLNGDLHIEPPGVEDSSSADAAPQRRIETAERNDRVKAGDDTKNARAAD